MRANRIAKYSGVVLPVLTSILFYNIISTPAQMSVIQQTVTTSNFKLLKKSYVRVLKFQLHAQTFLDIVKTTNFSRCTHRALYHHGLGPHGHTDSGDSAVGSAFAHSSTTRQIVEGTLNSYLLHSAVTTSQFEASLLLYNEKRAKVNSRMNVTLVKATWDEIDFSHLPENAQKRSLQLQIVPRALQEHFVHDEEVRRLPPLYSASLLAFTDLLRQAYVEGRLANARYPVHMYRGLALGSKLPPRFYVGYLARRLQRAVARGSSRDAQLLIRALGNVGDRSVAQALAPFLRGAVPGAPPGAARVTAFQRVAMVTALAPLAAAEPDAARALAFSVFRNQEEAYEVRVAAVFVLMCAQPPADLLQRLAQSTHWERSPHVVAAVRSAIQSAAALNDPYHKQLAKNARAALGLLNSQPLSVQYSRSYVKDYFIHGTRNMGYSFIHNYIGSNDHIIPKALYMGISRYLGGMDVKKERMSAMVSSVSQLLRVLGGGEGDAALEDEGANAPLEAQLRFPVPGGDAFLPLDQDDFARLRRELQGMALALEEGGASNYNKLYSGARMSLALPDAAGNVVYYAYRTPSLLSLQVKGRPSQWQRLGCPAQRSPQHPPGDRSTPLYRCSYQAVTVH